MNLSIKTSVKMSSVKSPLGVIEDSLIRMPKAVRDKSGYQTGSFLKLKSKDNKDIFLQVTHAYKNDTDVDPESVYVSDSTYELLAIAPISIVNPAEDILLGCDPEFFLIDKETGRHISASHFFPHYGQIGSDLGLAELRPRPSMSVSELTNNLKHLIHETSNHLKQRIPYRNRDIKLIAASANNGVAAGFHVHFGIPDKLLDRSKESDIILFKIVYLLDYYVGILSVLPEGSEDAYRRTASYSLYGKPSDFRCNINTLEYRVPGGHLLRHPLLTAGLFALSKIAMKDIMSRMSQYTDGFKNADKLKRYDALKDMYHSVPERNDVYASIATQNPTSALKHATKIHDDFTKMIGYKENEPYVTAYFNYIIGLFENNKKFTANMEENWRN